MDLLQNCLFSFLIVTVFSPNFSFLCCFFHRYARILPLLTTVCHLALGFPTQTPDAFGTSAASIHFWMSLLFSYSFEIKDTKFKHVFEANLSECLQMISSSSRWTFHTRVHFPPPWAAPSPSPARSFSPPLLLPPSLLPLNRGSNGLWCPVESRHTSWWRKVKK